MSREVDWERSALNLTELHEEIRRFFDAAATRIEWDDEQSRFYVTLVGTNRRAEEDNEGGSRERWIEIWVPVPMADSNCCYVITKFQDDFVQGCAARLVLFLSERFRGRIQIR